MNHVDIPFAGIYVVLSILLIPTSLAFQSGPTALVSAVSSKNDVRACRWTSCPTSGYGQFGRTTGPVSKVTHLASVGPEGGDDVVHLDTHARQSLPPQFRLVRIHGKGLGVITTQDIPFRSTVGDYKGEIMSAEEKDRRYIQSKSHLRTPVDLAWTRSRKERGQTLTASYLYGVQLPSATGPSSGLGVGYGGTYEPERIYIDSEDEDCSLWTRFLNHAPGNGANLIPKSIHESWDGNPRVWFIASRDIKEGEELCFDYGDDYWLEGDDVVV